MTGTKGPSGQLKRIRKLSMKFAKAMPLSIVEMPPRQKHGRSGAAKHDIRLAKDHSASQQSTKNSQDSRGQHIHSDRVGSLGLIVSFCKPGKILQLFPLSQ